MASQSEMSESNSDLPDLEEDSSQFESPPSRRCSLLTRKGKRGTGTRGRGRGRGRKKFSGKIFKEGEEETLINFQKERQKNAEEMIEQLSEFEAKTLLLEISTRLPALVLDVAEILSKKKDPTPPSTPNDCPSWCTCNHCPPMRRDLDRVCCKMQPQYCISIRPEMSLIITDPLTLHIQQTMRNDVFAHQAACIEDVNKSMRHAAYRQYILWLYGVLARHDRRIIPACCVSVIRHRYPSITGEYTGFIPNRQIGW